jgi:hypothetical protein
MHSAEEKRMAGLHRWRPAPGTGGDPAKPNGLKIRGVSGDVDKVAVQSSEQSSHLLTRRRWSFLPLKWTEVTLLRDEVMALTCNDGEAVVELKNLGGPHGEIIFDDAGRRVAIREGSVERLHLKRNQAVVVHTRSLRHPNR